MFDHSSWRKRLAEFDRGMWSAPNWTDDFRTRLGTPKLNKEGRTGSEQLILEILTTYASTNDAERDALRKLIKEFPRFAHFAAPPAAESARATLFLRFLYFSLLDPDNDSRDIMSWLERLCQAPDVAVDDIRAIRAEVARLSNDTPKLFFGPFDSTRTSLLRGVYGPFSRASVPE
jgi:hypothetical protein